MTESTVSLKLMRRPGARPFPLRISTFTRPFWDALAAGRLISTRFGRRGRISLPPKPLCRSCWSEEIDWVDLRPSGTLYSFTRDRVVPRAFLADALYEMGIVDLSDGVRLMCRLLDVDADADTAIAGPCGWSW